jgi:hypothetical protein
VSSPLESYCAGQRDQAQDVALGQDPYSRECPLCGNPVHRLQRTCPECDAAPACSGAPTREQLLEWIECGEGVLALNPCAPEPAVSALRVLIAEWRQGL